MTARGAAPRGQGGRGQDPPGRSQPADPPAGGRSAVTATGAGLLAAGMGAAAPFGRPAVLIAVAVLQVVLVVAWVFGTGLPGRIGGILISLGTAVAADLSVFLPDRPTLAAPLGVLALVFVAMVVHQLTRGVVRVRVTESMSDIGLCCVAVVGLAVLIALAHTGDRSRLVSAPAVAILAGLAVAAVVDAVAPVPRLSRDVPHGLLAIVFAAAAGAAVGALHAFGWANLDLAGGCLLGAVVAALAALLAVGVGYLARTTTPTSPRWGALAIPCLRVVLPLALTCPVAYVLGLALTS